MTVEQGRAGRVEADGMDLHREQGGFAQGVGAPDGAGVVGIRRSRLIDGGIREDGGEFFAGLRGREPPLQRGAERPFSPSPGSHGDSRNFEAGGDFERYAGYGKHGASGLHIGRAAGKRDARQTCGGEADVRGWKRNVPHKGVEGSGVDAQREKCRAKPKRPVDDD